MKTNPIPSYSLKRHYEFGKRVARCYDVYETRGSVRQYVFTMYSRGERLQNLLRRGVPLESARALCAQMGKPC